MVSKVWGMVFNKIYLMTEGETLNELQLKGDRLVDMMAHERRSGMAVLRLCFFNGLSRQGKTAAKFCGLEKILGSSAGSPCWKNQ